MSWAAKASARRAYKVVRHIAARDTYVLVNWCGLEFQEPAERLDAAGYRIVQARPAYAEPGHYVPARRQA